MGGRGERRWCGEMETVRGTERGPMRGGGEMETKRSSEKGHAA